MNDNDLIKKAAEIMGWHEYEYEGPHGHCDICGELLTMSAEHIKRDWNPIKDANHLNMVAERLLELGFALHSYEELGSYMITVIQKDIKPVVNHGSDYSLTRLTAYVEAFEKWRNK